MKSKWVKPLELQKDAGGDEGGKRDTEPKAHRRYVCRSPAINPCSYVLLNPRSAHVLYSPCSSSANAFNFHQVFLRDFCL